MTFHRTVGILGITRQFSKGARWSGACGKSFRLEFDAQHPWPIPGSRDFPGVSSTSGIRDFSSARDLGGFSPLPFLEMRIF